MMDARTPWLLQFNQRGDPMNDRRRDSPPTSLEDEHLDVGVFRQTVRDHVASGPT